MSLGLIPRVRVNYTFSDLLKAMFTSGKRRVVLQQCEAFFSDFFEREHVCLTPSARDAIYEVLVRLPQKKVLVPAYTCIAVVEAVKLANKEIVFCDTDTRTFNANYTEKITPDSIVLATHQYGLPCKIEEIAKKCKETGAVLIEDCATSMGTTINGKKTGTFGDYAVVSFNASKLYNVPPAGGVLVSKNKEMVERIKREADWKPSDFKFKVKSMIRGLAFVMTKNNFVYKLFHYLTIESKGKLQKTEHEKPAETKTDLYNYAFTEWQARILYKQLQRTDYIFERRKQLYPFYDQGITTALVKKPVVDDNAVCCRYAIQTENRNEFYRRCVAKGVDMDFSHCSLGCPDSYKPEHEVADRILNLPFYVSLSDKEVKKVIGVVNSIANEQQSI